MGKSIWHYIIRNNEKIMKGHVFYYDVNDSKGLKEGGEIEVVNPRTRKTELCKITQISPSEDTNTGEKGIIIHFREK